MTDKDKIRAEVDRLLHCTPYPYNLEAFGALQDILSFIDSLPEEPVSEELEDAAIEICSKVLEGETILIDGYEYVVLSDAEECFKAGAQWQKKQMMKDAVDGYIKRDIGGQLILGIVNAPAGDEFILLDSTIFSNIHCGERCNVKIIIKDE